MNDPGSNRQYNCLNPDDLPTTRDYPCDRHPVSDEAGLGLLAAAIYEIAPGEQLPRSYHYHEQREELFSVREGTLTVETPDGEYEVEAGEIFVAHPESPHRPYNPKTADESVVVLGVGAPSTDIAHPYDPEE